MRRRAIFSVCAAALLLGLLCACAGGKTELPEPAAWYGEIDNAVDLSAMTSFDAEYLEGMTGVGPELYESAVYYLLADGMGPDEIVIARAKDDAAAAELQEKLESRLAYKKKSATMYLTEYLPTIEAGVVRRDGLTVSLLVSEKVDAILEVYRNRG